MKAKKACKLKSNGRYEYYKSFSYLAKVIYRLRGDKQIRHYLKTGKYIEIKSGTAREIIPGSRLLVKDLFITSKVKRSRVKNIPNGCVCVREGDET